LLTPDKLEIDKSLQIIVFFSLSIILSFIEIGICETY